MGMWVKLWWGIAAFLLLNSTGFAQTVIIEENFSDGDFSANPTWIDTENKHIINSSNQLQLNAPYESNQAVIATVSDAAYGEWEALVKLDFNPSGSNLSRFYIIADTLDFKGSINGYFIQIGGTPDEVSLYRQDGNSTTKIIDGTDDLLNTSSVNVRIRATRDLKGNWELYADSTGGESFTLQGSITDNTHANSNYIGFLSDYTSTRSDLFAYDAIIVTKITPPLAAQKIEIQDNQTFDISFNQKIDPSSISSANFFINEGIGPPQNTAVPSPHLVRVEYNEPVPGGTYSMAINNVKDIDDNTLDPDTTISFQLFDSYSPGDVIINEFAYDHPSSISEEYIELKNTSDKYLNLANWQIADNNSATSLDSLPIIIEADSFLVISADTTELYNLYGPRAYHEFGFPALNNTTPDAVVLKANDGSVADSVAYSQEWGGLDVALERRSDEVPALYPENWGDSPSPEGGSPGLPNAISPDTTPPSLVDITLSTDTLKLIFDERLDQTGNYKLSDNEISSIHQESAETMVLTLGSSLKNAQEYALSITEAGDIFGNKIVPIDTSFIFYKPAAADSGDIAINEFMNAPPAGSTEYIELYNHSEKSLDLAGWTLSDNRESSETTISNSQFIVPPDSFVVLAPDNTLETDFPEIALISINNFPTLNNGGDQIIIHDKEGTLLDSLEYSSSWGGTEKALERRSPKVSGVFPSNWTEAPNNFGTPGSANQAEGDRKAPELKDLLIQNNHELLLIFSEQIESITSENITNYVLSENIPISNAHLASPDSVFLTLENSLQNATDYNLEIKNISDVFGNAIDKTDTLFTFYQISDPDSGDVHINEFMPNPPTGETEYLELYNSSPKSLNLQNWTINDNTGKRQIITSTKTVIPPDSFIVIAPDETLLTIYTGINLVTMPTFPSLNNNGDDIVLRNDTGILLDSLQYTFEWGGKHVALERRSTEVDPVFSENWSDAPNGFGTPGAVNGIDLDETPPTFDSLTITGPNAFQLVFSEPLDLQSATLSDHFEITPRQDISLIISHADTVSLYLKESLESGKSYEITAKNIVDIFGNALISSSKSVEYIEFTTPEVTDIIINEILYTRAQGGGPEYVELYNRSDKNIDLSGWKLGDAAGIAEIQSNTVLKGGEFLVLTDNTSFATSLKKAEVLPNFPTLNDNGDTIFIETEEGLKVDSLHYVSSWGGNQRGIALERKDPEAASNDPNNWSSAKNNSPGTVNTGFEKDENPPYLTFSKYTSDNLIEVQFNEFINKDDKLEFTSNGQSLVIEDFDPQNANHIRLSIPSAKSGTNLDEITVHNLSDIKGNTTSSQSIPVSQPLNASDIVINEIMYNPLRDPDDNLPDQSEYIELRNNENYAVSLEGVYLHDEPDENGNIHALEPVISHAKWIPAGGVMLIHADESDTFEESQTASFFELSDVPEYSIMRINRSSLSLASTNDAIFLSDSTSSVIDSVFYDENWQNPNLIDTRGVALERIDPTGPSSDPSNWSSSTGPSGGTPSRENTIYQASSELPTETGISFEPNPFSPDDDGRDDILFINYRLDEPDYLIKVTIYDRYGRTVRRLADGQQAGFEGSLQWDGRRDDGSSNRIGIYIIIFEAFNSNNGRNQTFKKTVSLARRLSALIPQDN